MESKNAKKGYTMIVVLCLLALFTALGLALLFAASLPVSRANISYAKEQSRISAITFSKKLEKEAGWSLKELNPPKSGSVVFDYIRSIMDEEGKTWPYYDTEDETGSHNAAAAYRSIDVKLGDDGDVSSREKMGDITITMYWQIEDTTDLNIANRQLVIITTCTKQGQEYSVTSRYDAGQEAKENPNSGEAPKWDGTWGLVGRE